MSSQFFTGHRDVPDPLEQYLPDPDQLEFEGALQITINAAKVRVSDFALPVHQCMFGFWQANRPEGGLPPATAIEPLSFPEAVGFVHVAQPNQDGTDFLYRLYASKVSEIGGLDMTGKWFSESPISSWQYYRRQLAATVVLRTPLYSENNASYEISVMVKWCRLLLPMVDEDGAVSRILIANVPESREILT